MKHFDIIYIHKWSYGGCCLHWQGVKNSWQTKKKVDRCATSLNLNIGLWTSGGIYLHYQQPKESFSLMFVRAPHSLCPSGCVCVQMVGMFIATCMFVYVRVLDMQMIHENIWQIQYIFALDCKTRWLRVHVCLSSHSTSRRVAYWVENHNWDKRWK